MRTVAEVVGLAAIVREEVHGAVRREEFGVLRYEICIGGCCEETAP